MAYPFENLVFEGGGVKGIAYVGAMGVLGKIGILDQIKRVGGTSAGAINATLFSLGYTQAEQERILSKLDFKKFLDDEWGILRDSKRLVEEFGWYKGDYFHEWISNLVGKKLGTPNATFRHLQAAKLPDLYVYSTNLSTGFSEVSSVEHTPNQRIADAVRLSMSIPLFFSAVRNARGDVYVDGGLLDNYPVKVFDREKYIQPNLRPKMARPTDYYKKENTRFLKKSPGSSPYTYNRQTLGFRLDSKKQIAMFRYGAEPDVRRIDDFFDYAWALISTTLSHQDNTHLHSDDWQRTVYIDTLGIGTTDFDLSDSQKRKLIAEGEKGVKTYLKWFDDPKANPVNRP